MEQLQSRAVIELANMQPEDEQQPNLFQPYKSIVVSPKPKTHIPGLKQRTMYLKHKAAEAFAPSSTRRDMLKKQLQLLEDSSNHVDEEDTKRRVQTSTATYARQQPVLGLVGDRFNKYSGFPAQPIKKQPERIWTLKKLEAKENSVWQKVQIEDLIRLDIKKKFKMREFARQTERIVKINNFVKMLSTPKGNITAVSFKNQGKVRKTLNNLLS